MLKRIGLHSLIPLVVMTWQLGLVMADTNLLTGANDIVVVRNDRGQLQATPFNLQFGKKDIWIPRAGHTVTILVNGNLVPQEMILDNEGIGYFHSSQNPKPRYQLWASLIGRSITDPPVKPILLKSEELEGFDLKEGKNSIVFRVTTATGSKVSTSGNIYYLKNSTQIVVTDIDGTITRSDVRGLILPALGLSDWKHDGIVKLYSAIGEAGYTILYLTSRPIGQADSTKEYLFNLREGEARLPQGPVLMYAKSIFDAVHAEVVEGNPQEAKIAKLKNVAALFPANPFYAAYGNKDTDVIAYTQTDIPLQRVFRIGEDSILENVETKERETIDQQILRINTLFPYINL